MAEYIQEEGSEEKKQGADSQDDEDFGLPDLEFEELEELDLYFEDENDESDEEIVGEFEFEDSIVIDEENETTSSDTDLVIDDGVDPDQDASRVLEGEDDEVDEIDFSSSNESVSGLEEEKSESIFASDSDIASDSEGDSLFGESEDFEGGAIFESDDIALKEEEQKEEFQPAEEAELPPGYKPYSDEGTKGGFAKIIIFGTIGITLIGMVFLFASQQGGGDESAEKKESKTVAKVDKPKAKTPEKVESKEEATKPATDEVVEPKPDNKKKPVSSSAKETQKPTPAPKVVKKVSKPASSAPAGEIINVQNKTGRSYVIIGSFIDEDLANDFAKELSNDGKGAKIIFPYGKSKRYRVSVADFDSYSDAASQMDSYKSTYGDGTWALKY